MVKLLYPSNDWLYSDNYKSLADKHFKKKESARQSYLHNTYETEFIKLVSDFRH
jgi:hypothetical protein